MGYWGLQDIFPLQQNLPNHFGEIRIHLQTFSYYYKPFLVSDLGDRGTDHLWFWLWKPLPFKGVGSRKRDANRHGKDHNRTACCWRRGSLHWGRVTYSRVGENSPWFANWIDNYIDGRQIAQQLRREAGKDDFRVQEPQDMRKSDILPRQQIFESGHV